MPGTGLELEAAGGPEGLRSTCERAKLSGGGLLRESPFQI